MPLQVRVSWQSNVFIRGCQSSAPKGEIASKKGGRTLDDVLTTGDEPDGSIEA